MNTAFRKQDCAPLVSRTILLKLAESKGLQRVIKRNGMSAGFARRFIAGETMDETVEPVRALNALGITASLDYLGENVHSASEAEASCGSYVRLLDFIAGNNLDANISLKLTQLGLDIDADLAERFMVQVLDSATQRKQFVRIDMEGSAYTERTIAMVEKLWRRYNNVGTVVQSYLYRTEKDVDRLLALGSRVRLVKGAYNEPDSVAFKSKADADANYIRLMKTLVADRAYHAIATHDERIIQQTIQWCTDQSITPTGYEFQMLYGVRRERQMLLVRQGYNMRVYVPFGTQWYGYMMRRLAERPANIGFVLKNLLRA